MDSGSGQRVECPSSGGKESPSLTPALKKFYWGQPLALGITQIIVGILEITFGVLIDLERSREFYAIELKTPQWTGILGIISGSLSVAAAKNPKKPLLTGMIVMNAVTTFAAVLAVGISSSFMGFDRPPGNSYHCASETDTESIRVCRQIHVIPYATMYYIVMILLMFHVLLLLVGFFTSVLGCVTMCHDLGNYDNVTTVVVYHTPAEVAPAVPSPSKEVAAP